MSWWQTLLKMLGLAALDVAKDVAEDKLRQKAGVPRGTLVDLKAEADKRRRPVRTTTQDAE